MHQPTALLLLPFIPLAAAIAAMGSIRPSTAPSNVSTLSAGGNSIEVRGATLAQIMEVLVPGTAVRIGPDLRNSRFDALVKTDGSSRLI